MTVEKPTVNSVISRTPDVDLSQITATTEPVSTVSIEDWLDEALHELSALADNHGIDETNENVISQFQRASRAYASAQIIKRLGGDWEPLMDKYQDTYDRYDQKPENVGGSAQKVKASSKKSSSDWTDKGL